MQRLENFLKGAALDIDREINKFFPEHINATWLSKYLGKPDFEFDLQASQCSITEPIRDFLGRGGKRWRPALMLLASEAVGGTKNATLPFTIIPELAHNGTIMVDDVEDNSLLRRGKPCTHIIYGTDVAINTGNALYFLPLAKLFSDTRLSSEKKAAMYDCYSTEMLRLSFGQALDIYWHRGNGIPTEEQYLQMCYYKTGSLARMAAELGAVIGGGSKPQVKALGEFAGSLGVAFQIQDDILNILPENRDWGKEVGDDIKEGKRTIMIIRASKSLPKNKSSRLLNILDAKEKSAAEVAEAISLITESGSVEYARGKAKSLVIKSWAKVAGNLGNSEAKELLKEFSDYLVQRKI